MKTFITTIALVYFVLVFPVQAEVYAPTDQVGVFLRQFEKAYKAGDHNWIRSAVDKGGVVEEAKALFFGFLGPKDSGESIDNLMVMAAPHDYTLPNSLIDSEIHPSIPVDFILSFTRKTGEFNTTVKVPVGYRDGKIWIVGIQKK